MSETIRVFICDPDHPHYGESGELTGEIISVVGTPMAKVALDACKHGTDGCFVQKGQIRAEQRGENPSRRRGRSAMDRPHLSLRVKSISSSSSSSSPNSDRGERARRGRR